MREESEQIIHGEQVTSLLKNLFEFHSFWFNCIAGGEEKQTHHSVQHQMHSTARA